MKYVIVEDKESGKRGIYDDMESARSFIESCSGGVRFVDFEELSDASKFMLIKGEYIKLQSRVGLGYSDKSRKYTVSISLDTLDWLLNKIEPSIDFNELLKR